jgi:uncharacterized protein YjiS (DUF1127 family)
MKNENRAVFDRAPEPIDYAFDLPAESHRDAAEANLDAAPTNFALRLLRSIAKRWRDRRNHLALLELSEDQLKDIGISRCQAHGGYARYRRSEVHRLERRR